MKIIYIGNSKIGTTSRHRADALRRMGNLVEIVDPYIFLVDNIFAPILNRINFHTGYFFIQWALCRWLEKIFLNILDVDLIWVDSGELFGSGPLKFLRKTCNKIILYNHDDPTGVRDGNRFYSLKKAIKYYTLCAVVRDENVDEFYALGANRVIKVWRSYDELQHAPFSNVVDIPEKFCSEVAFIGTWMRNENRDKFLIDLAAKGVPISIWGGRWNKSPYWDQLKSFYRGKELKGRDYVAAIQGAKICLGFLSAGNRDLHTTRSMEIPYAGGLLCAQRTSEHEFLYLDGEEAVFWSSVDECATLCINLLSNEEKIDSIKVSGRRRVLSNHVGHEDQCQLILSKVINLEDSNICSS